MKQTPLNSISDELSESIDKRSRVKGNSCVCVLPARTLYVKLQVFNLYYFIDCDNRLYCRFVNKLCILQNIEFYICLIRRNCCIITISLQFHIIYHYLKGDDYTLTSIHHSVCGIKQHHYQGHHTQRQQASMSLYLLRPGSVPSRLICVFV